MTSSSDPSAPTADTIIWRYMSDWKFAKMLERFGEHDDWVAPAGDHQVHFNDPGQLWFAFPWTFGDRLEGSLPKANENPEEYCDRMAVLQSLSSDEAAGRKRQFLAADTETLRRCILSMAQICGVSCWNADSVESADMWRIFVPEQNGVAIRTTVGQVGHALAYAHNSPRRTADPTVCAVGYVDHSRYHLPEDGFRNLLGIIRCDYSYENEVRFVAKSADLARIPTTIRKQLPSDPSQWDASYFSLTSEERGAFLKETADKCAAEYEEVRSHRRSGFNLPIKLEGFLGEVILKTGCTSDYCATVANQLQQAGLSGVTISPSSL